MRSLRLALVGLGVAGTLLGVVAVLIVLDSEHADEIRAGASVVTPVVGFSFLGTGLFAWWRRPANATGPLMTAIGFAWFLSLLDASAEPVPFAIGGLLAALPYGIFLHMLVAFPSGRLSSRTERALVGIGYFDTTVMQAAGVLFLATGEGDECSGCPANPVLIADNHDLAMAMFGLQTVIAVGGMTGIGIVLARRWRAAPPGYRRALGPVLACGTAAAALLMISLLADFTAIPDGAAEDLVDILSSAALAAVPFAFLAGLLRSRLSGAAAVSDLVARLGDEDRREGMADALARALGDPTLTLAYWVPDLDAYADADGSPIALPGADGERAATAVEHEGEPVAMIIHDPALEAEAELVRTVGAAASLALENERLEVELRARVAELRASRARIVSAGDAARRRLERDLHDGAQQRLVLAAINLQRAAASLDEDPERARSLLADGSDELAAATTELRELARGLHPAVLTDRGLGPALQALAERATVRVTLGPIPAERLPAPVEVALYFVVAEALTNVARYAEANVARIEVAREAAAITVEITDDGIGGADPSDGSGLRGLADRVAALDGRLDIESPPGAGTTVRATLPLPADGCG